MVNARLNEFLKTGITISMKISLHPMTALYFQCTIHLVLKMLNTGWLKADARNKSVTSEGNASIEVDSSRCRI